MRYSMYHSAHVSEQFVVGYPADNGVLTDRRGNPIGTWKTISTWRTPDSSRSPTMSQIEATVNDVVYTGRGAGIGMIFKGKRKAPNQEIAARSKVYVLLLDTRNELGNIDTTLLGVFTTKDRALAAAKEDAKTMPADSSVIVKPNDQPGMGEGFHLFDTAHQNLEPIYVWYVEECRLEK